MNCRALEVCPIRLFVILVIMSVLTFQTDIILYELYFCVFSTNNKCEEGGPGNPVGELQEFTQKRLLKPPVYEFSNDMGPPHAREFSCVVKLGKYTEKGEI